jgi:hypothetical protein
MEEVSSHGWFNRRRLGGSSAAKDWTRVQLSRRSKHPDFIGEDGRAGSDYWRASATNAVISHLAFKITRRTQHETQNGPRWRVDVEGAMLSGGA